METRIAEVGDGIYQLMTYLPEMDFAVNQYLITGDEPLLFHTGMRGCSRSSPPRWRVDSPRLIALDRVRPRRGRRVRLDERVAGRRAATRRSCRVRSGAW